MLFSLLIANYNNSRFLHTAIRSICDQIYASWEIILVDDGSTDNFEEIILPYINDVRIKIVRNGGNFGCAYAKWNCIRHATGEVMAFVDPDDALVNNALSIMAEAHREHPECSIIYSTHFVCNPELKVERISLKPGKLPENTPYLLLSDGSIHHFATFKKALYDQTAGLMSKQRHKKAVDQELYYLLEETGPVYFIDMPLYYYRIHSGSISNWGHENEAMKCHLSIIEEACLRRIDFYRSHKSPESQNWIKIYRTRYYKVCIMNNVRRKEWFRFIRNLAIFPFVGGMENMVSYAAKFSRQGFSLLRKSFIDSYQH